MPTRNTYGSALLAAALATTAARAQDTRALVHYVDSVATAAVAQRRTAGVSVAVVKNGRTVLAKGYGFADLENDVPATARPKASETCLACHGTNGVGITADYPTISGQHKDYIERALHDYQKGGRKNPIMAGMAQTLTKQDIEQLAEYYSKQTPALETLPKRSFFFSAK